jgi:hypothetical protein
MEASGDDNTGASSVYSASRLPLKSCNARARAAGKATIEASKATINPSPTLVIRALKISVDGDSAYRQARKLHLSGKSRGQYHSLANEHTRSKTIGVTPINATEAIAQFLIVKRACKAVNRFMSEAQVEYSPVIFSFFTAEAAKKPGPAH